MTIARVQAATPITGATSASPQSISLPSLPASGNMVILTYAQNNSFHDGAITGVVDNQGNTFTKAASAKSTNASGADIWYCVVGATSGTYTVTMTWTGTLNSSYGLAEYSGLAGTKDKTGTNQAGGSATTATVTASGANATADSLEVVVCAIAGYSTPSGLTHPPTGFTNDWFYDGGIAAEANYKIASSIETAAAVYAWTTASSVYSLVIATFQGTATGNQTKTITDGVTMGDAQPRLMQSARAIADAFSISDSRTGGKVVVRNQTDTFVMDPDVGGSAIQTIILGEAFFPTDLFTQGGGPVINTRTPVDAFALSDSLAAARRCTRILIDAIQLADAQLGTRSGLNVRSLVDALGVTDALVKVRRSTRALVDPLTVTDGQTGAKSGASTRTIVDALSVSDTSGDAMNVSRLLADAFLLSDVLTKASRVARSLIDAFTLTDADLAARRIVRVLADQAAIADVLAPTLRKTLTPFLVDAISIADIAVPQVLRAGTSPNPLPSAPELWAE